METERTTVYNGRFYLWALPLGALLVLTAVLLWRTQPVRELRKIKAAYESGSYETVLDGAENLSQKLRDESDREALLFMQTESCVRLAEKAMEANDREETERYLELAVSLNPEGTASVNGEEMPLNEYRQLMMKETAYREAALRYEAADYAEAKRAFLALGSYRDSAAMAADCDMRLATELLVAGDRTGAALAYLAIGSEEAREKAIRIAVTMTGITDPEEALRELQGVDAETLLRREELRNRRERVPKGVLALGKHHTVGITPAGTAVTAGDNSRGQRDTETWSGLVAVAAGAYHTAGLKKDGTVVAAGDNSCGQCDTGDWKDIVAIACNDYNTLGLRADGELLTAGYGGSGESALQTGEITAIAAGGFASGVLKQNGAVLTSQAHSNGKLENAVSFALHNGYAVGLGEEGEVLLAGVSGFDGNGKGIEVSASATRFLVLTAEGKLIEHAFRPEDALLGGKTPGRAGCEILLAVTGSTHLAVLYDDGTVACFGENGFGECDTEAFRLRTEH